MSYEKFFWKQLAKAGVTGEKIMGFSVLAKQLENSSIPRLKATST